MHLSNIVAYMEYSGFHPTEGMSTLATITVFIGIPAAVVGAIWLLWSIPAWRRNSKTSVNKHWTPNS